MSASRGNYIGLKDPPEEQFGKTMRIPDELIDQWWTLVAEQPVPAGEAMQAKLELARWIVRRSWGEEAAHEAEEHFTSVVRRGEVPEHVDEFNLADSPDPVHLPALLAGTAGESSSHWRRLIDQGGIKLNGQTLKSYDVPLNALDGAVIQAGKRRFVRFHRA